MDTRDKFGEQLCRDQDDSVIHRKIDHHSDRVEDLTGRDRMAWNVIVSWIGQCVFILAGFVLPRTIDRRLGQESLGVWDFGWTVISYLGLAQVGIGSSVNRYVAKYRSTYDAVSMNRAVTSVFAVQSVTSVLALLLAAALYWLMPVLFGARLGVHLSDARWLVVFLGCGLAVQILCNPFVGVITGCHRWDLHTVLNACGHAVTVAAMVVMLILGGGLCTLAVTSFLCTTLTELCRGLAAHRVCPELRIRPEFANWQDARQMLGFGLKTLLSPISRLLLYQTTSLLVVSHLGPAALAVYSRPASLVRHVQTFVNRIAFVLTPAAGSLQALGRQSELALLMIQSIRYSNFLAFPMVVWLVAFSDTLLEVWMGHSYKAATLLTVLALGHLPEITRQPVLSVMTGINKHGYVGMVNLAASICGVLLVAVAIGPLGTGLIGAAIGLVLPLVLVNGIIIPIYACRCLHIRLSHLVIQSSRDPLFCVIPFGIWLLLMRTLLQERALAALIIGSGGGSMILACLYWRFAIPSSLRTRLGNASARAFRHLGLIRLHGDQCCKADAWKSPHLSDRKDRCCE